MTLVYCLAVSECNLPEKWVNVYLSSFDIPLTIPFFIMV